jgi:uncharacterized protein YdaU (DUF1376 family)
MHYYKRNIGDYAKKAGRLTMLQHGAYTLLLDACYDREQFPTREEAIDWLWASSTAEIEAVDFVLSKFFHLVDGRFVQNRIQEELAEYHEKSQNNKRIAQEREAKRREKSTKRAPVVNEPPPNQEPLTTNQEPRTTHTEAFASGVARDDLPEPHELPVQTATSSHPLSGVVCKAIKQTGIGLVNPGHPKLNALLHAGVTVEQVLAACQKALDKQKTFSYAIGILQKEEEEARDLAKQLSKPKATARNQPAAKSFAQQEREAGWLRWEEMTGRKHPEMEKVRQSAGKTIELDAIEVSSQVLIGGMQ